MEIIKNLVPTNKWVTKCPYPMQAEFYVVHNTFNDATARNEIQYMVTNDNKVSFHYAIDDKEIVQGIEESRNAWHAGDGGQGIGNRRGIGIEICYSKSGGKRFDDAERLTAKFIANGLKQKGWGIDKVKKHQDFSGKYCPHRTLDLGWDRFINMVKAEMEDYPVDLSGWAREGYDFVVKNKISDAARPKDPVTREELWTMLHRFKGLG